MSAISRECVLLSNVTSYRRRVVSMKGCDFCLHFKLRKEQVPERDRSMHLDSAAVSSPNRREFAWRVLNQSRVGVASERRVHQTQARVCVAQPLTLGPGQVPIFDGADPLFLEELAKELRVCVSCPQPVASLCC